MINRILPRKLAVDTDERSMQPGDLKQAVNITIDADSDGDSGVVKFADGNVTIEPSDPESGISRDGNNTVIGSVADEELGVIYFFVHNDQGNHGVYAYSDKTKTYRLIFKDASLDFDKEGFVKGDIVRIKKKPDLVQASINVSQGEGGVQPDFNDGGGIGPANPVVARRLQIKVVKDLTSIVELHREIFDEATAIDNIVPGDYRIEISGTYVPETTAEPIRFYDSEVDLNLNPEYLEEIGRNASAIVIGGGESKIEFQFSAYVDPEVADGDFDMTYSIKTLNGIPTQGLTSFDVITFGTTLNSKTITQDNFTADSYDESASPRVLGVESKFKENLTVGNVFSLVPEGGGNSAGAILEANTTLANNYVDPNGSGNDVQTSDNNLTQRTARVRLKIDYTNSEAYAAAQDYLEWLDYADNGPDGWPNDDDEAAVNRNKALLKTPDDPDNYVSYAVVTRCPFSFKWRLWSTNAGSLSRFNADGESYSYGELYNQARQQLSDADSNVNVGRGIDSNGNGTPSPGQPLDDANNFFFSLSSATAAASQYFGVQYINPDYQDANYFNVILVPYVASNADGTFDFLVNTQYTEGITCDVAPPDAIFNPKIYVIPVEENDTDPARSYSPKNFPTIDTIDAWANYLTNPVKIFDIDIPMSGPLDGTTRDVIVAAYNDGISQFKQQEDIINTSLYSYAFQPVNAGGAATVTGTDGMFEEGGTESLLALDNSVFFSFSGAPQEVADVRGRRMRIPLKRNAPAQTSSAELAGVLVGSKRREIRCVPYSFTGGFNPNLNETFCFSSGFSCTDPDKSPPPPGTGFNINAVGVLSDKEDGQNIIVKPDPPKDPTQDDPRTGDDPRGDDPKPPTDPKKPSTIQTQQVLNQNATQPTKPKGGYNPKSKY